MDVLIFQGSVSFSVILRKKSKDIKFRMIFFQLPIISCQVLNTYVLLLIIILKNREKEKVRPCYVSETGPFAFKVRNTRIAGVRHHSLRV